MATQGVAGKVKHFQAQFVDEFGNPTTVDTRAQATVTVTDATLASIENLSPDGLSGDVRMLAAGTVQVSLVADADRGAGVRPLTLLGDLEILAPEAVGGSIVFTD